ncbi:Aste57867_8810 [Aphanomyces stellatus]|uniref:Aste57867_8810 protein n=1 Tax=Aphanomyces stellatus TaxID=120398 RepID=A0A485KL83_9STRA|nr:hypothetical protein As57867_008775 [Aphanomyces stellatus]VFT85696.1 Aste57867_8810 [Aphanomyces stellatus]
MLSGGEQWRVRGAALLISMAAFATWTSSSALALPQDRCSSYLSGEAFVERVERFGANPPSWSAHNDNSTGNCLNNVDPTLAEVIISHELDVDNMNPLSLLVMADSTEKLLNASNVIATTYFGHDDIDRLVRLDLHEIIKREQSRDAAYQFIHTALTRLAGSCPRRNMVILDSLDRVPRAMLPLLDVFLQPLSGKIARPDAPNEWLDTRPTTFVFLFETPPGIVPKQWKDVLDAQWTYDGVEFTPRALIGRLRAGIHVRETLSTDCARLQLTMPVTASVSMELFVFSGLVGLLVLLTLARHFCTHSKAPRQNRLRKKDVETIESFLLLRDRAPEAPDEKEEEQEVATKDIIKDKLKGETKDDDVVQVKEQVDSHRRNANKVKSPMKKQATKSPAKGGKGKKKK